MRSVLAMILMATSSLALAALQAPPPPPPLHDAPIGKYSRHTGVRHAKPRPTPHNHRINPSQVSPNVPVLPPLTTPNE